MEAALNKHDLIAQYYRAHHEDLRCFVQSRIVRKDISEDIVQTLFERLLTTDKMLTPVTMPCLIYTMARNLVCDYWRHHRAVEEFEHYLCGHMQTEGRTLSPESVYSAQEITELLERSMARLSSKQREVYALHIYQGMKVSEISNTLHINYKSVENRLGAARKQVRYYMQVRLAI